MTCGLNLENITSIKRKLRWLFMGFDEASNVVFEYFVKVQARPDFPYSVVADENGGHKEYHPGEICFSQYFLMMDDPSEVDRATSAAIKGAAKVNKAVLRLVDGVGRTMEEWSFQDVCMTIDEVHLDEDILEWKASYKQSDYVANKDWCK